MSTATLNDLWGELPAAHTITLPSSILAEQAVLLGNKTSNVLQGEVKTIETTPERMRHTLNVRVPILGNYRFALLAAEFNILAPFPCLVQDLVSNNTYMDVPDEERFRSTIREILQSGPVRSVIATLLRQA